MQHHPKVASSCDSWLLAWHLCECVLKSILLRCGITRSPFCNGSTVNNHQLWVPEVWGDQPHRHPRLHQRNDATSAKAATEGIPAHHAYDHELSRFHEPCIQVHHNTQSSLISITSGQNNKNCLISISSLPFISRHLMLGLVHCLIALPSKLYPDVQAHVFRSIDQRFGTALVSLWSRV